MVYGVPDPVSRPLDALVHPGTVPRLADISQDAPL